MTLHKIIEQGNGRGSTSGSIITDSNYPWQPYQPVPSPFTNWQTTAVNYTLPTKEADMEIRKVSNGFILKTNGDEFVFESTESLNKFIAEFYSKV